MTPQQAYYLDCIINGAFIGTWLGMISLAVDNVIEWWSNLRIGSK